MILELFCVCNYFTSNSFKNLHISQAVRSDVGKKASSDRHSFLSKLMMILCYIVIVIVIALCLQYELKGYPRKFLELLTGTPPHLTLNQVSYHSAESTEEIA